MTKKFSKIISYFVFISLSLAPCWAFSEGSGFLTQETSINSETLLPPPPAYDSIEFLADKAAYDKTITLKGTERWQQAYDDANLSKDNIGKPFAKAFGLPISKEQTPETYKLLYKLMYDAGFYAPNAAKIKYQRMRPFVYFNTVTCKPDDEGFLRKDGSYPSGHTSLGWATALVLSEIRPERANILIKRGFDFGQSRVVCGAHWQSDISAGRVVGAAQLALLHTNQSFLTQLKKAKEEVAALLKIKK